ncbi:short chain dehydrogenase reductase [Mytilinidion resinicola]|uniref:Short chain dehydrogenase reductase n=1 Tax=Mytilinidion resinicola TaxID=574789 RepID=A0A6A6YGR5_9PEZI|nr:short chain dehydrogenase reductase [Mytilinidion resinicola]KAF2808006.1 short chain dehydrogenase reductase [Mytilinidion resinicola]
MPIFTKDSTGPEVAAALASYIEGKVIIITGCSPNGPGATAALAIAPHHPALIILTGRTRSLIEETEREILKETPDAKTRLLTFDFASLESVREAAKKVNRYSEQIDVLNNNAGIMATPFEKTVDGIESQFAVNHLGPFLFTNLVLGKFPRGGRIVNVSSTAYHFGGFRFDDPNFETEPYNKWLAYAQSKTANILFSAALAERLGPKNVFSFSLHVSGGIYTNLGKHMTAEDHAMLSSVAIVTHQQGTSSYIAAAFDPELEDR